MSIIDDLQKQIKNKRIIFDKPEIKAQLLGAEVTGELQALVHYLSTLETLRLSSIIRSEGGHGAGRAFDVGNEEIAKTLLPIIATDAQVAKWKIDELIFDAAKSDASHDRNKWNYDNGVKHAFDGATLNQHGDHIHFAVKTPSPHVKLFHRTSQPATFATAGPFAPATSGGLTLVDFRTYPVNHVLPADFTIAGVAFSGMPATSRLMVNTLAGDLGLQFEAGLRVVLRRPVNGLLLYAGGFAGAITLTVQDSYGVVIYQQVIRPESSLLRILLNEQNMRTLELTGGRGEGMLMEIIIPD